MNVRSLAPLHQLLGPSWSVALREDAAWFGTRDRWIVHIEGGVARVRGSGERRDEWIEATLDGDLDEVVLHARWWRDRLTIHRLEPGRTYEILSEFGDVCGNHFRAGEQLTFERLEYVTDDDGYVLHFGSRSIWLPVECDLTLDFDMYLAPAAARHSMAM